MNKVEKIGIVISVLLLSGCSSSVNPWYESHPQNSQSFAKRYAPKENAYIMQGGFSKKDDYSPFVEVGEVPTSQKPQIENPKDDLPSLGSKDFSSHEEGSGFQESAKKKVEEKKIKDVYEGNGYYTGPSNTSLEPKYESSSYEKPSGKSKRGENSAITKFMKKVFTSEPKVTEASLPIQGDRRPVEANLKYDMAQTLPLEQGGSGNYGYSYYDLAEDVMPVVKAEEVETVDQTSDVKIVTADIKPPDTKTQKKNPIIALKDWVSYWIGKLNFISSAQAEDIKDVKEITKAEEEEYNKKYPELKDVPKSQQKLGND